MGDILSADEIQALLASYAGESEAPVAPATPRLAPAAAAPSIAVAPSVVASLPPEWSDAQPAQFEPPDALSRGKRIALENALRRAAERTASNLEAWLADGVRGRLVRFGLAREFAPDDSDSITRFAVRLRDEEEEGEAAIELPLASALVRSKLKTNKESVARPLTEVEMAILEAEATTLVAGISESTEPLLGTPFALGSRQREAWDVPRETSLLWARFEFTWEGTCGQLWIGLPAKTCRARMEGNAAAPKLEPKDLAARWTSLLEPVRVPVAVRLGRAAMTVEELVRLERGDVILLEGAITDALELTSGGCPIHVGRLGQFRGRWTFRVEKKADRPAPPPAKA